MLFKLGPELLSRIVHFASFPQTGVSLRQMVDFGHKPSPATLVKAATFLADELPIRLAHRVVELDRLPHGLSAMPSVIRVKHWYAESFQELVDFSRENNTKLLKENLSTSSASSSSSSHSVPEGGIEYNKRLTHLIEGIKRRHDPVVTTIANGILELKNVKGGDVVDPSIQSFLDRFYMSRIGIRMLIGQHIVLQQPNQPKDYVGIICTQTNLSNVAQEAIDNARFICEEYYDLFKAPEIMLHCDDRLDFMYVPSHLHHMLFELLKNSLRAVVEHHGVDADEYPPIKCIIAEGKEDITVKISDEGGGIPRSGMKQVWTYMYTTAKAQPLDPNFSQSDFKAPMAGFGYGLPLSRLECVIMVGSGGDLRLISMEGYGTDAYLHLARLSDTEEPLP